MLWSTFINQDGSEATISGTPTITIRYKRGSTITTKLNAVNMTLHTGSTYYYDFYVTTAAPRGVYDVLYEATYVDATEVKGIDAFNVVDRNYYNTTKGSFTKQIVKTEMVWSKEEKERLVKQINNLTEKLKSSKQEDKLSDIDKKIKQYSLATKKIIVNVESALNKKIDSLSIKFAEYPLIVENLEELKKSKNDIETLARKINGLETLIISSLDDESLEEVLNSETKNNDGITEEKTRDSR